MLDTRAREISDVQREHSEYDGDQEDLAERRALRRIANLSTELEDVTEVEYRQLRLERVVLAGLWTEGTVEDAENSLRELAALAEPQVPRFWTAWFSAASSRTPAPSSAPVRHWSSRTLSRRPVPIPSLSTPNWLPRSVVPSKTL